MVLEKDPAEDITQLEEINYTEFFSDINTPGIWKAENEEDLKTAKIIVLDGHSTILVYNQSDEELPWTAYNELGQYKYTPDNIGDGIVIFSHTFYFEFNMLIGNQMIQVESTFDGNSIEAIVLPMKDVSIDDLINIMTKRIEDAVNSEVQSFDDTIDVAIGKKIEIPDSISMKIGMKLSLMGITLAGLKANNVIEIDTKKEESVVEQVFDEKSSKMKDMLEEEEKELKKRKRAKSKKKVAAPNTAEISAPETAMRSGAGPTADALPPASPPSATKPTAGGPPPVSSPGGAPAPVVVPPSVASPGAAPPPPPSTKGVFSAEKAPSPPPAKPKPVRSETPLEEPVLAMADIADMEEEEEELDADMGFEGSDEIDDELLAKGMEVSEKPMTLRFTHTSYFSRMLLNRAYPLVVKISMDEVGVKKTITSIASGEKISEKEESIILEEEKALTIRPEFPGCFVVPFEQEVELSDETIEVKFHVTPLALGMLDGSVKFLQSGKTVHSMHLETKVITHRLSRWLATIGASASVVPTMVAFLLNETPAQFMEKRMDNLTPSIGVNGLAILGVFTAFFLFLSGFVYRMQKPQRSNSSLAFPR